MAKTRRITSAPVAPSTAPSTATAIAVARAPKTDAQDYAFNVIAQLARGSFSALSNPRRRRLRPGDGSYHCDYRTVEELRNISRWLEYHSGSYAGALHNWSQYLVGEGPTWTPTTSNPEWNRRAAELLAADFAAKRHDVRGRHTWGRWIKLLATSIVRDGAMGVVHTATGAAQLIEAERVVAIDSDRIGRITLYQVAEVKNGFIDYTTKQPIYPTQMDWCAVVTRVSQDLGVPMLFSTLDDHDGVSELWQTEITTATEASRPWLRIEHADGNGLPGGQTIPEVLLSGNASAPAQATNPGRSETPAGWVRTPDGNIMGVPPGLKTQVHQPLRPNLDVPAFTKAVLRMACMMLLPYELLFGDQADISYSNGRSIRKLGNGLLTAFRNDYLNQPLTRIVHQLLRQHMLKGELDTVGDWRNGKLEWDEIPEHDRIKERQADTVSLGNKTETLKDLVGEQWQEKLEQSAIESLTNSTLAAENLQKIQKLCNKLNAETEGLDIKWSHLVTIAGAASAPGAYLQAATGAVAQEVKAEETGETKEIKNESPVDLSAAIALAREAVARPAPPVHINLNVPQRGPVKITRAADGTLTATPVADT